MRARLHISGGYAGLTRHAELDTDELDDAVAAAALAALDGYTRPAHGHAVGSLPRYRLTIERPTGPQVVDLVEPAIPAAVRPLLTELLARAHAD